MTIFSQTHTIAFETSNSCQLASLHQRCPLSLEMSSPYQVRQPAHLLGRIVYETLDVMGRYNYEGAINFHQYSEPLIEPRLFEFVRYGRKVCPAAQIIILTNGLNLSYQLAEELCEAGVTGLWITSYGSDDERAEDMRRVKEFEGIFGADNTNLVPWCKLDGRMRLYGQEPLSRPKACYAPLCTIVVARTADVSLCCYDWKRTVTFGNLNDMTLEDILLSGEMQKAHRELVSGNRNLFDVCRRCDYAVTPCG